MVIPTFAGGLDVGITSATCGSSLGSGEKAIGRRSCINHVKGFKVFGQSELQGGKSEWGHTPKQWKLQLQNEINNTRFQASSMV
jgi:hypothetical protein